MYISGSNKNTNKNMKKEKKKKEKQKQELPTAINSLLIKHVKSIPTRTWCRTLRSRNKDEILAQKGGEARGSRYLYPSLITVLVNRLDL